jgi:predicted nucleotidyltransferase
MGKMRIDIPEQRIVEFCKKWNVKEFGLFGSVLSNDFDMRSDIDVLVTFFEDVERTLFDLVKMEDELKEIFGREVDIVSRRGIESSRNSLRRNSILESARTLYAEG